MRVYSIGDVGFGRYVNINGKQELRHVSLIGDARVAALTHAFRREVPTLECRVDGKLAFTEPLVLMAIPCSGGCCQIEYEQVNWSTSGIPSKEN